MSIIKYSCSNPNQKSLSLSSINALPLDSCGVPSAFNTSVITRKPFSLAGSGYTATGFKRQSEEPPSACFVDDPSNDHTGQSSNLPLKSSITLVLLRMFCVGLYPSSQMYSSFDLLIF